jgi:hypothetical protein
MYTTGKASGSTSKKTHCTSVDKEQSAELEQTPCKRIIDVVYIVARQFQWLEK